ncbi:MAG: ABC transporter [Ruminiclostridium sp.]|nr:ABC transporter [Ruminiclostridium sp.]
MDKIINAFKRFFNKRSLKYGSNSIILIAAVVGIAILVNVLVGMADVKLDLTANKLFSLTDVTRNVLKDLKQDVTIIGLFDDAKIGVETDPQYKEVTDLLSLYGKNGHIKVEYIDPDKNPGIIKKLDEQNTMKLAKNDFIVKSTINGKDKKKKLGYYDLFNVQTDQQTFQQSMTGSNAEQGITGAIKYVSSEKTPVVYFTEGHSEIDVNSDYKLVKQFLETNNYEVKTINLTTAGKIPEDAEIVVVASPKNDLSMPERDAIEAYLKAGGKAVFMFDYLSNDPDFNNFNSLLSGYNVAVDYDKVKETDANRHSANDPYTILLDVSSNAVVSQSSQIVLKDSRSISILKNTKEYIKPISLIKTGNTAIGEPASASRGENMQGPLDIAVAVENSGGEKVSKILVMGNATFVSDSSSRQYANYYQYGAIFFVQSLNWMFDKKDEVVVPTKNYEAIQINITQLQATMMGIVLVIILPLIILGIGLFVFLRRRHL